MEILSPGTRKTDEVTKRKRYEHFGVLEYWVVDPELDVMRIYRQAGETFARPVELSSESGDVLTSTLLPGLELLLQAVFKE